MFFDASVLSNTPNLSTQEMPSEGVRVSPTSSVEPETIENYGVVVSKRLFAGKNSWFYFCANIPNNIKNPKK